MRSFRILLPLTLLAACSPAATEPVEEPAPAVFEAPDPASETAATEIASVEPVQYWGVKPGEPLPVIWQDLIPPESEAELLRQQEAFYAELEKRYTAGLDIAEGSEADVMPQFGTFDVADELDGQLIRIPGYVVPVDGTEQGRYTEFLFVPYMGACIHTPPPPPNQIILVRAEDGVRVDDIWMAYYLEGTLSTGEFLNDTGNAAYALDFANLEPYPIPEP